MLVSPLRFPYFPPATCPCTQTTLPDFTRPPFAGAPEARFAPLPADGVLPEGFFSTSNLPTYVHVDGQWVAPTRPRMDCVRGEARRRARDHRAAPPPAGRPRRHGRGGGRHRGHRGPRARASSAGATGPNEFRFMSTEVSRERPVNYEELAARRGRGEAPGRLSRLGGRPGAGAFARAGRLRVVHPERLRAGGAGRERRRGARHRGRDLRHHPRHDQHRPADRGRTWPPHARHQPGAGRGLHRAGGRDRPDQERDHARAGHPAGPVRARRLHPRRRTAARRVQRHARGAGCHARAHGQGHGRDLRRHRAPRDRRGQHAARRSTSATGRRRRS